MARPTTRRCCSTIRCRRRCCSPGSTSACSTGAGSAIVGTRNATAAGRDTATTLGRQLADAGVHVVSGLARGIDGCAHRGALAGRRAAGDRSRSSPLVTTSSTRASTRPVARVAERGLLLSEAPPGTPPEAYRFPLRNRIIAALAEVVVVVESREHGGSLITVNEAIERDVPVMAVPGGVHNRAAAGTNQLIRDGRRRGGRRHRRAHRAGDGSPAQLAVPSPTRGRARAAPTSPCTRRAPASRAPSMALALACSLSLVEAAMALARLEQAGWIQQADGWFEVVGSPLR